MRDLFVNSNACLDPQAFILAPENALKVGRAITETKDHYDAVKSAALKAVEILKEAGIGSSAELKYLELIEGKMASLPEGLDGFLDRELDGYRGKLGGLDLKVYGLG